MKNLKKIIITGLLALTVATTAFAASAYNSPAEIVAGLTGRSVESVIDERHDTGKSFGTIAKEAGKLDEFKTEVLELRKDQLAARVADGRLTQEQADRILASIEERQALCDGDGYGCGYYGNGNGNGNGDGWRNGGGRHHHNHREDCRW
ncbi:DUF2680 domain-containing protein [uncultured Megamonas sp.]|uniref:DUF2680 domain-containing protein n=1 Tax=uncultured Megamonas sp. TaxID=286140 RepID=UPI0026701ADB|nr:DUF2680 domain-containing protein [uncultured Megamonas sp.]